MRTRSKPLTLIASGIISLGALLCATSSRAAPVQYTVHSGFDLFSTVASGTSFDGISFQGDPLNTFQFPGTSTAVGTGMADTIMQRLDNVTAVGGGTGTTNIQLVALQLESVNAVYDGQHVFATLDTTQASTGTMNITFNSNGTGGTYGANFNVYVDLHLGSLTGQNVNSEFTGSSSPIEFNFTTSGNAWSRTPPSGAQIINGINHNLDGTDTNEDFWENGPPQHNGAGASHHTVTPAAVPEASTLLGFGSLVVLGGLQLLRKRNQQPQ